MIKTHHYDPELKLVELPGKIYGHIARRNIHFIFDPGTYQTIVTTRLTDSLGYHAGAESKRVATTSVIGKEYGYTIVAQKLEILGFAFSDVEIACFDLPEQYGIDGLLGLDLLRRFEITWRHQDHWIRFRHLE